MRCAPTSAERSPRDGCGALVAFVQVSDLHVTDAQSPGRPEFLDRLGDDDSPVADLVGAVGTYRAQESLTHHVVEAMTARLRRTDTGPVTGLPVTGSTPGCCDAWCSAPSTRRAAGRARSTPSN